MKPSSPRKAEWFVWGGLALTIAAIVAAFALSKFKTAKPMPVISQLSDFTLTNQDGATVSLKDLRGHAFVADVIFTRCPGPCAVMSHGLADIQKALPPGTEIVTLTSDPEYDSPEVLKKYAMRFNADTTHWMFLTGPKPEMRHLEINDFKFVVVEKKPGEREAPDDLFIHSTWFVLVDKQGRVRGWTDNEAHLHAYLDSTEPDIGPQIISAINQLQRED